VQKPAFTDEIYVTLATPDPSVIAWLAESVPHVDVPLLGATANVTVTPEAVLPLVSFTVAAIALVVMPLPVIVGGVAVTATE
jgi:hypothetical protein